MQEAITTQKITLAHAKVLLSCSKEMQKKLFQKMLKEELTVDCSAKIVKNQSPDYVYYKDLQDRLQRHFGLKVEVDGSKNRGQISLRFLNLDELDTILDKIGVVI